MRIHRVLLIVVTCLLSLLRFGHLYPDSVQYLAMIDLFRYASSDFSTIGAPFVFRPVMPFIVALISGQYLDPVLVFSILNVILLLILGSLIYDVCILTAGNENTALLGALVPIASYPLVFFGPVPLVDVASLIVFLLIIISAEKNYHGVVAAILLIIGVFIKEVVLFFGLYYVIRRGSKSLWVLVPAALSHIGFRILMTGSVSNTLGFTLSIISRPIEVVGMFFVSFAFPVLIMVLSWRRIEYDNRYEKAKQMLIAGLICSIPLLFLGLFFAYFDGRFIWPILIILAPYVAVIGRSIPYEQLIHGKKKEENGKD